MSKSSRFNKTINPIFEVMHLDDDPIFLEQMQDIISSSTISSKVQLHAFDQVPDFLQALESSVNAYLIVILDVHLDLQEETGQSLASKVKTLHPNAIVLMCSDLQDAGTIRSCLAIGADDFLFKGADEVRLISRIETAMKELIEKQGRATLHEEETFPTKQQVGKTASLIKARIPKILNSAITSIHVTGESGTGKEIVADLFEEAITSFSTGNKSTPFVRVHCGAITPSLLESELFGHVKGAFTGATSSKIGLIERADGGWIFLDEVATLPALAQVALLRALENRRIRPVGANIEKLVSIRVISATNESLPELVKQGKFRLDLWQRLCETTIELPPLRQRMEEIPEFIHLICQNMVGGPYKITNSAVELLSRYDWRNGNIRELRNCLRAMTESHSDKMLTPATIPKHIWEFIQTPALEATPTKNARSFSTPSVRLSWTFPDGPNYSLLVDQLLIELIQIQFQSHGKLSLRSLADSIHIPRSTLSTRLKALIEKGLVEESELRKMVGMKAAK